MGTAAVIALAAITACGADSPTTMATTASPWSPTASTTAVLSPTPDTTTTDQAPTPAASATPRPTVTVVASPADLLPQAERFSPQNLSIPSVDIEMPVSPHGVDDIGFMSLPDLPTEAGWYQFGPVPGDAEGATVIAGHVDSAEFGVGPLKNLRKVAPGSLVTVFDTAGTEHRYRVDWVQSIPLSELDLEEVFDRTGPPRLHVVTCGGAYIPEKGGYQNNVIMSAIRES